MQTISVPYGAAKESLARLDALRDAFSAMVRRAYMLAAVEGQKAAGGWAGKFG